MDPGITLHMPGNVSECKQWCETTRTVSCFCCFQHQNKSGPSVPCMLGYPTFHAGHAAAGEKPQETTISPQ